MYSCIIRGLSLINENFYHFRNTQLYKKALFTMFTVNTKLLLVIQNLVFLTLRKR